MNVIKTAELTGHSNPIFTLELSQKLGILFTGGNDKGLVEWNLADNSFIKVMFPVPASIYAIHCPKGYPFMFAGLRTGEVLVFNFIEQKITHRLRHHLKPIFDIKSIETKKEFIVASEDGSISIWGLETMELVHTIKVSNDTVRSISISPYSDIAFGCRDGSIVIYDAEEYAFVNKFEAHEMAIFNVQYSPDGQYLLSGSRDAQLKIWGAHTSKLVQSIPAHLFAINHILFHPTRPYFATASMDKSIKIWDGADFKLRKIISREKGYPCHVLSINKVAWHGDELLSVSDDKTIMRWAFDF